MPGFIVGFLSQITIGKFDVVPFDAIYEAANIIDNSLPYSDLFTEKDLESTNIMYLGTSMLLLVPLMIAKWIMWLIIHYCFGKRFKPTSAIATYTKNNL